MAGRKEREGERERERGREGGGERRREGGKERGKGEKRVWAGRREPTKALLLNMVLFVVHLQTV